MEEVEDGNRRQAAAMANIGKRKPQQTIDRECASVNYTESASAEAQFHSSLVLSSQQSHTVKNCTHLRYAFTGACIVRTHSTSLLNGDVNE